MSSPTDNSNIPYKWAIFGFTTTPGERIGPDPPYTYPALQVNLFFRVFLGIISLLVTWIPARLLYRNGELSGMMLCAILMILNLETVINSLIWRNNDVASWYDGRGWCDLQKYLLFPLNTAYHICLFEVMRGLAAKCAIDRVTSLSSSERKRNGIISAFVIFTIPIIQMALVYPLAVGRFNVSILVGCSVYYMPNWVFLVFFVIPTPIFIIGAAVMAGITFYRYRKIESATRKVLLSQDSVALARQNRVRKKLYFTTLCTIIIVLPLIFLFLVRNIMAGMPWNKPFDFEATQNGPDPFNDKFISFTTSDMMNFEQLAVCYIPIVSGLLIFIPFGTTIEALNAYRKVLLLFGLGYLFPKLRQEIKPQPRDKGSSPSWWSSFLRPMRSTTSSAQTSRKASLLPTAEHKSFTSGSPPNSPSPANPWPDLSAQEIDQYSSQLQSASTQPPPTMTRPPFVITTPAFTPPQPVAMRFPPAPSTSRKHKQQQSTEQTSPRTSVLVDEKGWQDRNQAEVGFDTKVWSDSNNNSDIEASAGNGRQGVVRVETRINTTTTRDVEERNYGEEEDNDSNRRAAS
ncbi:pheromone A receptor-domain-containing protein [Podospora fimiseda]|uniref:Pheromone A receptor-domain-containing protein n=1 Tax=Podospora fimiseda TaxID=252190 RepID=A0AAN7GY63_9PEZI|nr:pheromone A receptor-domain-containing protein [Podospora fimiseda]